MAKEIEEGHPRRSTGNVMEPGDGYLPNGKPDLSPEAGYKAAEPVQYSDESDTQFSARVAMWESAKATAANIAAGGLDFDAQKVALKARYEADLAALDAQEKLEVKHGPEGSPLEPAKAKVKGNN